MRRIMCVMCCVMLLSCPFALFAHGEDAYAYPEPEVLQIDLVMHPSLYLKMIHSAEKQKYNAVVCIDEGEPQPIGVQVRGDRSLREGMDTASRRIPMELCFDYQDPDGAFRGNSSLKLINCLSPARVLTQLVAMQAFVFLGIPTPQVTPAFIRINDTDFGVYLAVEDLNGAFSQNRLGGASLYRPFSQKDTEDACRIETFDGDRMVLKFDGGCSGLSQFTQARNNRESGEPFLDVDEFLRYMACETFIMNDDGYVQRVRNFYLADDHGKLMLLPWDKDDVFPVYEDLSSFREFAQRGNPLFHELLENETYATRYRQYLRSLTDAFLNPDTFLPWLEAYIRVLDPFFRRDETMPKYTDDVLAELTTGNTLFNTMNGNLLQTFRLYHEQAAAQLTGRAGAFSIPQDMTLAPYFSASDDEQGDRSVIFRVCAGYWRLRRQALLQNDGKAMIAIGAAFAVVFSALLISVYHPAARRRRAKHTRGGTPK